MPACHLVACAAMAVAGGGPVAAQDVRAAILYDYPCAGALSTPDLEYLRDWANATSSDPCMLAPADFASTFGGPISAPAARPLGPPPDPGTTPPTSLADVDSYSAAQPAARLFLYQTLILGPAGADGNWGPRTATAFANWLDRYVGSGGTGGGTEVPGEPPVPRFLRWIEGRALAEGAGALPG